MTLTSDELRMVAEHVEGIVDQLTSMAAIEDMSIILDYSRGEERRPPLRVHLRGGDKQHPSASIAVTVEFLGES